MGGTALERRREAEDRPGRGEGVARSVVRPRVYFEIPKYRDHRGNSEALRRVSLPMIAVGDILTLTMWETEAPFPTSVARVPPKERFGLEPMTTRNTAALLLLAVTPTTALAAPIFAGLGAGGAPHVKVFDGNNGAELSSFMAYNQSLPGGVRVAAGDINGDGAADIITGAGAGGGPHVKVLDGRTGAELRSFFAFDAAFSGGITVAAGDVNDDGIADIVASGGPGGGPHVKVFDGKTGSALSAFFAFEAIYQEIDGK